MNILDYAKEHLLFLDGGMGTLLQSRGLQPGELLDNFVEKRSGFISAPFLCDTTRAII